MFSSVGHMESRIPQVVLKFFSKVNVFLVIR